MLDLRHPNGRYLVKKKTPDLTWADITAVNNLLGYLKYARLATLAFSSNFLPLKIDKLQPEHQIVGLVSHGQNRKPYCYPESAVLLCFHTL